MNAHRDMVLVDVAPNEEFAVIHDGERCGLYDDPIKACDCAEALAKHLGVKWDVTIQARNAADMS